MFDKMLNETISDLFKNMSALPASATFKLVSGSFLLSGGVAAVFSNNSKYRMLGILSIGTGIFLVLNEMLDPLHVSMPENFCDRQESGINYLSSTIPEDSNRYTSPISLGNSNFSFFTNCVDNLSLNIKQVFQNDQCAAWEVRTPFMRFTNWVCACVREGSNLVDIKSKSATGVYDLNNFNQKIIDEIENCGMKM